MTPSSLSLLWKTRSITRYPKNLVGHCAQPDFIKTLKRSELNAGALAGGKVSVDKFPIAGGQVRRFVEEIELAFVVEAEAGGV